MLPLIVQLVSEGLLHTRLHTDMMWDSAAAQISATSNRQQQAMEKTVNHRQDMVMMGGTDNQVTVYKAACWCDRHSDWT